MTVQVSIPEPITLMLTPVTYGSGVKVEIFTKDFLVQNTVDIEWGEQLGTAVGKHLTRFFDTYNNELARKKRGGRVDE